MKCPRCKFKLSDREIGRYLGSKGGHKATHSITPEHQKKMQAARKNKGKVK